MLAIAWEITRINGLSGRRLLLSHMRTVLNKGKRTSYCKILECLWVNL